MEEIRINRLPLLTYRYLHTNDTPVSFEAPKKGGEPHFSDLTYVKEGGTLPADFKGASEETVKALKQGSHYTITIPAETKAELTITLSGEGQADFAGSFLFHLGKESSLNLIWILQGKTEKGTCVAGAYYDLAENANLKVSRKAAFPVWKFSTRAMRYWPEAPELIFLLPNWAVKIFTFTATACWPATILP